MEDLSLGGCFFVTGNPGSLTTEDEVYGDILISDFKRIRFRAVVKRRSMAEKGKGFGLEFTELEGMGKQTLNSITMKAAREMRDYTRD